MNPYDCLLIYALPYQMITNVIMAVYCFPPSAEAFSTIHSYNIHNVHKRILKSVQCHNIQCSLDDFRLTNNQ